jgi:hypothetical protein
MTASEQTTINRVQIKQAEMTINLQNVQKDVNEIKDDLKEIKEILEAQKEALVNQRETDANKYVTKKFVIMSMSFVGSVLVIIAYFWQAIAGTFHK